MRVEGGTYPITDGWSIDLGQSQIGVDVVHEAPGGSRGEKQRM